MENDKEKNKGKFIDADVEIEEQESPKLSSNDEFGIPTTITNVGLAKLVSKLEMETNQQDLKNQIVELKFQNEELDKKLSTLINLLFAKNSQPSIITLGNFNFIHFSSQGKDHQHKKNKIKVDFDMTCYLSDQELNYIVNLATGIQVNIMLRRKLKPKQ